MNIFISVCDYSSELYAYKILEYIKEEIDGNIFAIGGGLLKDFRGINFWLDSVKYSAVGFFENLPRIPFMFFDYLKLEKLLRSNRMDYAILFDSPAVNLRLIRLLRGRGVKIIYIIPPKSWSLERSKVHDFVENNCDAIIVPFKFNLNVYKGKNVFYFGHPIVEIVKKDLTLENRKSILGIFPGSRKFEVEFVSKPVIDNVLSFTKKFQEIFISSTFSTKQYLRKFNSDIVKVSEDYYEIISKVGIALAVSGTVVLKNAIYSVPTVCFYKVYKISEFIFKKINKIKVDKIALPNILWEYEFKLGNECIVPELIQDEYNYLSVVDRLDNILENYDYYLSKIKEFRKTFFEFYPPFSLKDISKFLLGFMKKGKC